MQPAKQHVSSVDDFNKIGYPIGTPLWIALYPNLLVRAYVESKSYTLSIDDDYVWYYSWQNDLVREALFKRISAAQSYAIHNVFYDTDIPLGHSVPLDDDGWDGVYLSIEAARAAFKLNLYPSADRRKMMRFHKKLPALIRRRFGRPYSPEDSVHIEAWLRALNLPEREIRKLR